MAGISLALLKDQEGSQYACMNVKEVREDEVGGAVGSRILQALQATVRTLDIVLSMTERLEAFE